MIATTKPSTSNRTALICTRVCRQIDGARFVYYSSSPQAVTDANENEIPATRLPRMDKPTHPSRKKRNKPSTKSYDKFILFFHA